MFGSKKPEDTNPPPANKPPAAPPANEPPAGAPGTQSAPDAHLPAVVESTGKDIESKAAQTDLVDVERQRDFSDLAMAKQSGAVESYIDTNLQTADFIAAKKKLISELVDQIDFVALGRFSKTQQRTRVGELTDKILATIQLPLNGKQVELIKDQAMDELFGFGPIEPLLADPEIADIMINTHARVYVEKQGKIKLTDVKFLDEAHLLSIIQRIVSRVGRRVDESSPMVDARMPDGSRFNAIIPPLSLDGSLVSIRKFKRNKMPLSAYVGYHSMSEPMANFLNICGYIGLNMIVSGGTGSGKTTLLNALSGCIGHDERIITIEDAAELQFQQPHVLRLETRPASTEGRGEVSQRQLVKNALRMRPDRIILGEIRGEEIIDVLTAMNTGHDGSMATIHANNPRDCLSRIENLVGMSSVQIATKSLRQQIASAIQIIVQIERMRDGKRRIVAIEELVGLEGDIITTQTLFSFKPKGINAQGELEGEFVCHGIRPKMLSKAEYFSKEQEVLECFQVGR